MKQMRTKEEMKMAAKALLADYRKNHAGEPEACMAYPLPQRPDGTQSVYRVSARAESGEVSVFEFDFPVPSRPCIPWPDLDNSLPHHCVTCEWGEHRGLGTCYCRHEKEVTSGRCPDWEISPEVIGLARVEYYKALHEKHYGQCGIAVTYSAP